MPLPSTSLMGHEAYRIQPAAISGSIPVKATQNGNRIKPGSCTCLLAMVKQVFRLKRFKRYGNPQNKQEPSRIYFIASFLSSHSHLNEIHVLICSILL